MLSPLRSSPTLTSGNVTSNRANISLAHEIVMSLPSLYTGGTFLLYPARQAAKALGRQHRKYIIHVLVRVAEEIPIAGYFANILMAEDAN